ncbi:MAG: methylmalonyl-CoA mutase family protein, partial [Candidatus Deferrimicrobiota bacterium]
MYEKKKTVKIANEKGRWEKETLGKTLSRSPGRIPRFSTVSDMEIAALYTPDNTGELDYARDLSFPGEYPFTRGVQPSMYRGRLWTMRQFAGYGSAEDTNARFKFLLEQGQTGLSTAFH